MNAQHSGEPGEQGSPLAALGDSAEAPLSKMQSDRFTWPTTCKGAVDHGVASHKGTALSQSWLLVSASGVLYDDTIFWRWLMQLLGHMGMHMQPGIFTTLWQSDYADDVCEGRQDFWDALRSYLHEAGLSSGQIDEIFAAGRTHWRRFELELHAFPQAVTALKELAHSGHKLAVVMHSPLSVEQSYARLEQMRIASYFSKVITSRELRQRPRRRTFWQNAVRQLACPNTSASLISSDERQLQAAREAELRTIAFRCSSSESADLRVDCLHELQIDSPARPRQLVA